MSEEAIFFLALAGIIWIGWPLHMIAEHFKALRKKAGA